MIALSKSAKSELNATGRRLLAAYEAHRRFDIQRGKAPRSRADHLRICEANFPGCSKKQ